MSRPTKKQMSSLSDLIRQIVPDDESLVTEVQEQYDKQRLVGQLATLRNHRGISQADIAKELGCRQSRISKLENGLDDDVTVKDLAAYAKLANCDLTIVLGGKDVSLVDQVKHHAACIGDCFEKMNALAQTDKQISDGVAQFHVEALINLVNIMENAAKSLRQSSKKQTRATKISLQVQDSSGVEKAIASV